MRATIRNSGGKTMKKQAIVMLSAIMIIALIAAMPICEAQLVTYLPAWLSTTLQSFGIYGIVVGAVVVAGGYVVYHVSTYVYSYFTAYRYTTVSSHAYLDHAYDFPNIWSSKPPKATFDQKCKDNMNSKSALKYIQKYDGRLLSYNTATGMVSVGETDGKTVITCFPKPYADVLKKVRTGEWIKATVR
jgi:phosphatidylserine decarboxylase